jgi:acyl-coenzyme A synthetase/AMP-(fatty) acid ligase/aryl carrier-like protein
VVIAPRAAAFDGEALSKLLANSGITMMQATPVTWRLLLESGWEGSAGLKILCGGEALTLELAERLLTKGAEVWNLYGPTETTIWSTLQRLEAGASKVPIGRPIANTQVYVMDEYGQPVPPGVAGELYIGGDGLARGYVHREDLTAERFVPHPYQPGERLYRTGDLVRRLGDGSLECIARVDHQVKLRGFRIELGEIEKALQQQPGIGQAVVVVREDTPGDPRLTAYVTGSAADAGVLRKALQAMLPDYMVPSAFVRLDKFPLTPNRKVDRKALPAPSAAAAAMTLHLSPRTRTESEVAMIWRDLLRNPKVGVNDNFFDLGGHSLLVVQLQSRLRRQFKREISLVELFQHPTIAMIAGLLGEESALAEQNTLVASN